MEHKITLVNEGCSYYLLVFDEYSCDSQSHLRVAFPYSHSDQKEALEKARKFGRALSEGLDSKFEENLGK